MIDEMQDWIKKAQLVLDQEAYKTNGERLLLEALVKGDIEVIWNYKALIDVRLQSVLEKDGGNEKNGR